jgi:hypothetical protein
MATADFLESTTFLPALGLASVLAVLTAFFSTFFSAFLSDLAIVEDRKSELLKNRQTKCAQILGHGYEALRQRRPDLPVPRIWQGLAFSTDTAHVHKAEMSELEGNFDVIILGTGLVESITAAYVMHSSPMYH